MDATWLWRHRWPVLADLFLSCVLAAVFLFSAPKWGFQVPPHRQVDTLGYELLVAVAVVLLLRRWRPLVTLAAETLLVSAYLAIGYPHGPFFAAVAITGFTVGRRHGRRAAPWAAALTGGLLTAGEVIAYATGRTEGIWGLVVGLGVAAVVGSAPVLVGALLTEHLVWKSAAEEEALQRRVNAERLRMAREVHDVVGHSLSVISLQAGVALHVLDRRPDQAQTSLEAIRRTSIEALDELRATLALTRAGQATGQPDAPVPRGELVQAPRGGPATKEVPVPRPAGTAPPADGPSPLETARATATAPPVDLAPAERAPLTGLGRLPGLLAEVRGCGVRVEAHTGGPLDTLPAQVDLAVYRIVQESLTNVLRYAPRSQVRVGVTVADGSVFVDVLDRPAGQPTATAAAAAAHPGHGLTGLRERAAELGGWLTAGPVPDGGWRVSALLPLTTSAAAAVPRPGEAW